jgi:hypothetical protein
MGCRNALIRKEVFAIIKKRQGAQWHQQASNKSAETE